MFQPRYRRRKRQRQACPVGVVRRVKRKTKRKIKGGITSMAAGLLTGAAPPLLPFPGPLLEPLTRAAPFVLCAAIVSQTVVTACGLA